MKKVLVILLSLLLLAGCSASDGYAHASNESDVIFTAGKTKYTKGDLFYTLRSYDYSSIVMNDMIYSIMEAEGVDMTEYEESADSTMEMYRQIYGLENFDSYGGDDAFKKALIVEHHLEHEKEEMIDEKLDTYLEEDSPVQAKVAWFDVKEDAEAVLKEIEEGATIEMASLAHGFNGQISATVYLDSDSTLPLQVKEYLAGNTETGMAPVIIAMTTTTDAEGNSVETPRYYVIEVLSRDVNDFKEDYYALKSEAIENNDVFKRLLEGHEIHFYDQGTLDLMKKTYEGVFE
ncbi:MAG: hypothetical protein IIZ33_04450 [Erysipelotrichaceae bacterium]|nr:hypothetical protein [Erysipelotrichaceae bacterium]